METTFLGKNIVVTGGAGFIGSHLTDRLVSAGARVTVIDNLITGNEVNLNQVKDKLTFINEDVVEWALRQVQGKPTHAYDFIFHLASPASPKGYMTYPEETYLVNSLGTHYLSKFAAQTGARLLFTSTSESYGDPLEHPQKETYWGNVNPIGPRACYDESKRFGEMVMMTQIRKNNLDGRIVRIFNTYGPRMNPDDGRIFPNFINQALKHEPITVHGDGTQTRSFCFVSDLVEFLLRTMLTQEARGEVINIGNPQEFTVVEIANKIKDLTHSASQIVFVNRPVDDPTRRKPDISKAKAILGYEPQVELQQGLMELITYFQSL